MNDLILRPADLAQLQAGIASEVIKAIRPMLAEANQPRLVDRQEMAKLLSISVPTLDRLTSDRSIPSVLIKSRRLYSPSAVVDALTNEKGAADHE